MVRKGIVPDAVRQRQIRAAFLRKKMEGVVEWVNRKARNHKHNMEVGYKLAGEWVKGQHLFNDHPLIKKHVKDINQFFPDSWDKVKLYQDGIYLHARLVPRH
jgi:hypothetical protein